MTKHFKRKGGKAFQVHEWQSIEWLRPPTLSCPRRSDNQIPQPRTNKVISGSSPT